MKTNHDTTLAHPFIKWVGGKTQLLDEVKNSLPKDFASRRNLTYVEPFVGGGAVLFWILQEYPNITRAIINDVNSELVCTYRVIKTDVDTLITELKKLQSEYCPLSTSERNDYFMQKRALFNTKQLTPVETASLFIFLNRTCFNGLYRVNSKGEFNVPHGKYAKPRICDEDNLRAVSVLLKRVEILCGDFAQTLEYAGKDTIYYLDPPYKPLTETSSFTSYTKGGFNDNEQLRLRDFCDEITTKKAIFVASNSDPAGVNPEEKFFDKIYKKFSIKRVFASRMINSNPDGRGCIPEIMISNLANI